MWVWCRGSSIPAAGQEPPSTWWVWAWIASTRRCVKALPCLGQARRERGIKIAQRLEAKGFPGALAGALAEAGESQLGRPHFASWMVGQGHVKDHSEAFDKYLGQGKTRRCKGFLAEAGEVVAMDCRRPGRAR